MNQLILPIIPHGATLISPLVSVESDGERWIYFIGCHPVFQHHFEDHRCFLFTIASLVASGACASKDILQTFGISKSSLDRAKRKYHEEGPAAFFEPPRRGKGRRRAGKVMTPEVILRAQELLDLGLDREQVAQELGIKTDTLGRAIRDGRLHTEPGQDPPAGEPAPSDKSQRSVRDAQAAQGMGTGCTRTSERMMAAVGALDGAAVRFEACGQVPYGGVLCAVGALLANGLISDARAHLNRISGYYSLLHILLLLAFMSLCRIRTLEELRGKAPGEFGKLMGLDRVPEVRCLRAKLDELSGGEAAQKWAAQLARQWMEADPQAVGTLYVDGHVRVYHGSKTRLPRKYVSRQRLCLRGTTDYWVNDRQGRPFFVIERVVDRGLLDALQEDIVPRLLREVPGQPDARELAERPHRSRFILVFDREGYSPAFFREMWEKHRIGCITYHLHPKGSWPEEEFRDHTIELGGGETVEMRLAERGSLVGSGEKAIWMKEVRKLSQRGCQVSLIGTAYELDSPDLAGRLLSRWCQENYFRYMTQNFGLDLLAEYGTEPLADTQKVINPQWRALERERASLTSKLRYRQARFAAMVLHAPPEKPERRYREHQQQHLELCEEIRQLEAQLQEVKQQRKTTPKYIAWEELPEKERFTRPVMGRKRLMDAVRMIAYRAETAMCALLRSPEVDNAAARRLLKDLFVSEADLLPREADGLLEVRVHRGARPAVDRDRERLFAQLNEMEITFPGTDLRLHYCLLPAPPADAAEPPNGVTDASSR